MGFSLIDRLVDKIIAALTRETPPRSFPLSDFEKLRHEIRPGDVLLFEGRSRVSEIIKMVTQSSWSHAALYIGRVYDIEDIDLRQHLLEHYHGDLNEQLIVESLLGKGTVVSALKNYLHDHIRICRPKGLSHQDVQKVIGYTLTRLGVAYDVRHIMDLLRFLLPWSILPRRWRSSLFHDNPTGPEKEICSTLLAEAFTSVKFPILPLIKEHAETGVELIPRNPRLFTPSDFDYSPFFEIIKYPMIDISLSHGLYRHLPWSVDGTYSNDDGGIIKFTKPEVPAASVSTVTETTTTLIELPLPPAETVTPIAAAESVTLVEPILKNPGKINKKRSLGFKKKSP